MKTKLKPWDRRKGRVAAPISLAAAIEKNRVKKLRAAFLRGKIAELQAELAALES